jgi:hypothetical protein
MKYYCAVCILIITLFCFADPLYAQPDSLFNSYLNALVAGQWNKAENCWAPEDLICSKRLGINYIYVPCKYDCASPLFIHLDEIKSGRIKVKIDSTVCLDDYARLYIKIGSTTDSTQIIYYANKSAAKWHLVSPMRALTGNWKSMNSDYVGIRYHNLSAINQYALNKTADFINSVCAKLEMPDSLLDKLKTTKIDYYLGDESDIKNLTGFDTKGMANLQFDAVITQYLPHPHELVHLLINYNFQQLPLYTVPFMQEGLATYLGGRWGKSPGVIFYYGEINLALGMANLEDILAYNGFHGNSVNSDISYALSGLFTKYLIEKFGMDKFKQLYLELSGTSAEVATYSTAQIKSKIEQKHKMSWSQLEKDFLSMAKQYEYNGLKPVQPPENGRPIQTLSGDIITIRVFEDDNKYYFSIKSSTDTPKGILLFKYKEHDIESTYRSNLFAEQLPQINYSSEMYGLHFSSDEVGFYNYPTNTLLAKYVLSFSPSDIYWNPIEKSINFSLGKELLEGKLGDFELKLAEP